MNRPIDDPNVQAAFDAFPPAVRKRLLRVRALIFSIASGTAGVGELEETLRWGQPSYLTSETRSGSTIRIGREKNTKGDFGVYFNCNTNLVASFMERYEGVFHFDGNRAIVFRVADPIPDRALGDCIASALRYHLDKRSPRARADKATGAG